MSPKSGNRFWDKDMRKSKKLKRIPKSAKRFSERDARKKNIRAHPETSSCFQEASSGSRLVDAAFGGFIRNMNRIVEIG
jgi:hypothetical protein